MYRGFNLKIDNYPSDLYIHYGREIKRKNKAEIKRKLDEYLLNDGSLDGNEIMENWFPKLKSHIFLSHSHKDENMALAIAGTLSNKLGLKVFIDSTVWGYSEELLQKIDDKFCLNTNKETYNYKKRNFSTSHVHLMLSNALNKMIDSCECIIFLNTPNSVSMEDLDDNIVTKSPWIFSELSTSRLIEKIEPSRIVEKRFQAKNEIVMFSESKQIDISYKANLNHLKDLNSDEFKQWISMNKTTPENALDKLYGLKPL